MSERLSAVEVLAMLAERVQGIEIEAGKVRAVLEKMVEKGRLRERERAAPIAAPGPSSEPSA